MIVFDSAVSARTLKNENLYDNKKAEFQVALIRIHNHVGQRVTW